MGDGQPYTFSKIASKPFCLSLLSNFSVIRKKKFLSHEKLRKVKTVTWILYKSNVAIAEQMLIRSIMYSKV